MGEENQSPYRLCQSLDRGLALLAALNCHPGGAATISQLARQIGQHRTTVKRLLETLVAAGYVRSLPGDNLYRLTFRVRALSQGFRDNVWFTEVAGPLLRELGREVVWPCSILTLEGNQLVVRDSTRSYSPFSLHPGMPGRRLPLLTTAAGKAYLAFCGFVERNSLLDSIRSGEEGLEHSPREVAALVRRVRRAGYATNRGEWVTEERFGAVAVPILRDGRAIAAMNVTFLLQALSEKEAIERLLPALLEVQSRIQARYDETTSAFDAGELT